MGSGGRPHVNAGISSAASFAPKHTGRLQNLSSHSVHLFCDLHHKYWRRVLLMTATIIITEVYRSKWGLFKEPNNICF